ncbi:MAG: UDP-4-amino-4,6-dideoxy-N-acetyl-beta-L-altrosamine transaminase [Alphaproteobacteria bacterium]|nr:UDP-4-amino-4,6-dideoxy-N-acetyl-beta-L-altrosamine transaminase [Alphaproteobacteria bacterium]MBU0864437.1 UDP-4-amino-4,6-dideoxy-N-acetyl-beta-L-altrosamine transaminase [Alphaproteobacteria bacterium]MBU1823974.1 UDP-4-amino-4,6-dideoxy-N-acetyl-beta-L-altrosamine transaminase [Alphaproteobacteria bacterium]
MSKPIPYSCQDISEADIAAVAEVLRAPFLTQGPAVPKFEEEFAALHGMRHGVAVANATGALHIACLALGAGPGIRVWTTPNSFVASANCARYCGATVDFVDIDPATRNISVEKLADKLALAAEDGSLPGIVIPVDFGGYPCDMKEIRELADRYGFRIISDSSHAVGASYHGEPVGRYADISVFSFHPVKIITTGEGGLCLTDDADLAAAMRKARSHGITRDPTEMDSEPDGPWYYEQVGLGFNYRLTDIQAALGSSQLTRLAESEARRDLLARRYDDALASLALRLPPRSNDRTSAHHLYVIEIDDARTPKTRREVFDRLRDDGISPNVHYIPIHLQPDYRRLGFAAGDFPDSERYYGRAISIPLFPTMTEEQQDRVIASLTRALS